MIKQAKSPIANWKQIESNGFILSNRPKENKIDILWCPLGSPSLSASAWSPLESSGVRFAMDNRD